MDMGTGGNQPANHQKSPLIEVSIDLTFDPVDFSKENFFSGK